MELRTLGTADRARGWSTSKLGTSMLSASRGDVAVRQSRGAGTALLLVHGEGESMETFADLFASPLADRHHLVAFDLPGHGASGDPYDADSACTTEGYADLALEILERLGVDNAFVVDRTLGGRVGRELFMIFPEMLGLAVVGGAGREDYEAHAPIFDIERVDEKSLIPVLAEALARDEVAPSPVWFGG